MQTNSIYPMARKLGPVAAPSHPDLSEFAALHKRKRSFAAGRDIVQQGQPQKMAYILAEGWVCTYKLLRDGARQIVDFQIPGDFLGLRSVLSGTSDQSIEPITNIEVSEVVGFDLMNAWNKSPRLSKAILWAVSREQAISAEHLAGIGRRTAIERMAHLFLELATRLAWVGKGSKAGFACPLTQYHLADALGLTAIHVNRVLKQLREAGLVTFRDGYVTIHKYDTLAEMSGFEDGYLDPAGPVLQ